MNDGVKVLAVDDEEFNLDIISNYLHDAKFEVLAADGGDAAITLLQQNPDVKVIVLDRMMPGMDGMEVLRWLKEDVRFQDIPVIMQTAAASHNQIEEGIRAGVYYYLPKPYTENLLLSLVRAALRDTHLRETLREEMQKQHMVFGMLERACFRFRTPEEANNLSYLISNCFPDPVRVVYGLNELMINAIEHGNLGIGYAEKAILLDNNTWEAEVAKRLTLPGNIGKYATLEIESNAHEVKVTIKDQGKGFDWNHFLEFSPDRAASPNGRGIAIVRKQCFHAVDFVGSGNEVVCRMFR